MTLGFLADENVPRSLVWSLQADGHSVVRMRDLAPGTSDRERLERSVADKLVLLTEDNDFGELVFGEGRAAYAVVMIRFARFEGEVGTFASEIATRIGGLGQTPIGHLTIVEPERTRQRILPGLELERGLAWAR